MRIIILILALFLTSCASVKKYNEYDLETDFALKRYTPVINYYKNRIKKKEGSQVLNNLNLAMVYQNMGDYKSSNGILISVSRHIDLTNEYISISEETFALVADDRIKRYTFEEYEIAFLYYSMAMNCFMLGQKDNAVAQARKIDVRSRYMESEGKPWGEHEKSIYYLSATLYELAGSKDSAFIDYKRAKKAKVKAPYLDLDIWSVGEETGRDVSSYYVPKKYKEFKRKKEHKKMAEVIVFINNGWSPVKVPHQYNGDIPVYASRLTQNDYFKFSVNGYDKGKSYDMFNIEEAAKDNINKKFKYYRNRSFTKFLTTEALALPVGLMSGGVAGGIFLRGGLHSREKADFRSWSMMPKVVQVGKFYVSPGQNNIVVRGLDGNVAKEITIKLKAGQRKVIFVDYKSSLY